MMWCLVGGEGEGVILLSSSIDRRPSHQSHLRKMSLEQNFQRKARINLFRSRILSHSPHNLRQEITMKIKGWQLQIFWRKYHHLHLAEDSWYAAMHLVQTFCGAAMTDSKSRHLKKRLGLSVRVLQDLDKKAREIFRNVLRGTKAGSSPPPLDLLSLWQSIAASASDTIQYKASAGEYWTKQATEYRYTDPWYRSTLKMWIYYKPGFHISRKKLFILH